jgi:hypothetical protein
VNPDVGEVGALRTLDDGGVRVRDTKSQAKLAEEDQSPLVRHEEKPRLHRWRRITPGRGGKYTQNVACP